jgi:signal transduction histidine kinase
MGISTGIAKNWRISMILSTETLVPRIGDVLVEQKLLTPAQLDQALILQKQARLKGQSPLIGQILVESGFISKSVLDQAITQQVFKLQSALQQANETLEQRVKDRTRELESAYEKLTVLSKLKANFISNISHELRTPLTHIKGYVDLLLSSDKETLSDDQVYALEVLDRATERLGRLIDDLILFSTAETSSLKIKPELIDLFLISSLVIKRNTPPANAKRIKLELTCAQPVAEVMADADKIKWVIDQLVENAIKFTSPEGFVRIHLNRGENFWRVTIEDSGIGIQDNQIEEIFEPFHQLDGSSTRKQGGTGMGLTIAKKIIEAHGSKITVQSKPGEGSKFEFILKNRIL